MNLKLFFCLFISLYCFPVSAQDKAKEKSHEIRVIRLKGSYSDYPDGESQSLTSALMSSGGPNRSFIKLCDKIDSLASSKRFAAVYFEMADNLQMNGAQAAELCRHIEGLNQANKKTFVYFKSANTTNYSIAATCQNVIMANYGGIDLPSRSMSQLYMKDAMDLFGVQTDVTRAGKFKGAVEPYMLSAMSAHLKEHYKAMLTSMNEVVVSNIVKHRQLNREKVRALQKTRFITADMALKEKLVDALVNYGSEKKKIEEMFDGQLKWQYPVKPKPKEIGFFDLFNILAGNEKKFVKSEKSLAILHLNGAIVDGDKASAGSIVSGPTVKAIDFLAKDDNTKGVLLRINSPGGSVTASEEIQSALEKLVDSKPVIISMGNMAASGGYWISCLERPIYAEASTITGSIGVFGMKMSFGPLMKRIGVNVENIEIDESASAMSPDRLWTEEEKDNIQKHIDVIYNNFLNKVAKTRNKTVEEVKKMAGGRVFSGAQALKLGLVDKLGGIDTAIAALIKETGVEKNIPIKHFPVVQSGFDFSNLMGDNDDVVKLESLKLLKKAGFDLTPYYSLAQQSLTNKAPTAMVLLPHQFVIR